MSTWFTADTHFSHRNIIRHAGRPFSDENEMDEAMVETWNHYVSPRDTIYHLGDVSWRPKLDSVLSRLNGNKHLILGNHDKKLSEEFRANFKSIQNYLRIKIGEHKVILFHYPILSWDCRYHGSFHLFGHCHGNMNQVVSGRCMDVGVDSVYEKYGEFRPLAWEEVKEHLLNF